MFTIWPLERPWGISPNVSGLNYVRRGAGYKIHMCAIIYYLGRVKVISSVATDFSPSTISAFDYISISFRSLQFVRSLGRVRSVSIFLRIFSLLSLLAKTT